MQRRLLGPLNTIITGGLDRRGGGDGPVVVLMHGFGAPGDNLVSLARVLDVPPEVRFVFPAAPIDLGPAYMGGRAWWMIDLLRLQQKAAEGRYDELVQREPEGLAAAHHQIQATLHALTLELRVEPHRMIIGGFSQGAMLACHTVLHAKANYAGLAMFSGTIVAQPSWQRAMQTHTPLPVFMSHGSEDMILPFSTSEALKMQFEHAGYPVDWRPFWGGHEIAEPVVYAFAEFVRRIWFTRKEGS
jgi:phospholipase/carboxylesterase